MIEVQLTRNCKCCGIKKKPDEFYDRKPPARGVNNVCKPCHRIKNNLNDKSERSRQSRRNWRRRNKAHFRLREHKSIKQLARRYVAKGLASNSGLRRNQIPNELVELKRVILKIKRHLWNRQEQNQAM
jgi:hypothetical protein